jgi:hypothetical protein
MDGHCQCGKISFRTPEAKPKVIYVCHCTQCRHQSSSAFGITAVFPGFTLPDVAQGLIGYYDRPNSNGTTRGYFCTNCGSRLVHQRIKSDGTMGGMAIKGGCLDGLTREDMRSAVHIWTKEAIVVIPHGVRNYEGEPPD